MAMHILLIEDDDARRIHLLEHLLIGNGRVTACRSIGEADEILRYVFHGLAAPDVVIMAAHLRNEGGVGFQALLQERFPDARWIDLAPDCGVAWLVGQLEPVG